MTLADVNVLIYAFRRDVPQHATSRAWLTRTAASGELFGVSPLALAAVTRVTTNPRLRDGSSTIEEALAYCDAILAQPNCRRIEPGPAHWEIFRRLCLEANTRGPMITDAWYAALAIEHECTWITFDSDFARFPGLQWRTPE